MVPLKKASQEIAFFFLASLRLGGKLTYFSEANPLDKAQNTGTVHVSPPMLTTNNKEL